MFGGSKIHKAFFVRARTALCVFDPGIIILSYAVYVVCEEHYGGSGIGSFGGAL